MNVKSILPGATLGLLGGGQLGCMTSIEARKLGYRLYVCEAMHA